MPAAWDIKPEMQVWVPQTAIEGGAYSKGEVEEMTATHVVVNGQKYEIETVMPAEPEENATCDDNCGLMYLNEGTMLRNLERRFATDDIYTYTANILIAINPFASQPHLYTPQKIKDYFGKSLGVLPPHIFAIGDKSYRDMRNNNVSQCILCSGESGAGKTESTKYLLRYLTDTYGGGGDVADLEARILAANPMMESFGNAKTTRNNNSSRFGKFVELHFNRNWKVVGANIMHYLLEKSRVISPGSEERNYHVFYRLCRGAPAAMQQALSIGPACEQFKYLAGSQLSAIKNLDDKADYIEMEEAMTKCGLSQEEKANVFRITAAVLHIGSIALEDAGDGCQITAATAGGLATVCRLLGIKEEDFKTALCFKTISVAGTESMKGLDSRNAQYSREGLAKSLYSKLFDWIIEKANTCFPFPEARSIAYIGILDIAGFEYFKHNSFEQFCINYCNEKLQQFFNERTLKDEQELYIKEAINFTEVEFVDNHDVVDLIETPKTGILAILDETSKMPRADDKMFCEKLHKVYSKHFRVQLPRKSKMADYSKMRDDEGFIIRHFAGAVGYESDGFLEKNNDALTPDLAFLMDSSSDPFLTGIFKPKPGDPRPQRGKLTLISLGDKFKKALEVLMIKLNSCRASFVRCIKPNSNQAAREFSSPMVLAQLQCAGMVSVLELMQGGFPSRTMFQDLYDMYKAILPPDLAKLDPRSFAKSLFKALGMHEADFQFGISRVFFRPGKFAEFDTIMRADPESLVELVAKVQLYLVKARLKKVAWACVASFRFDKKIKARGAAATIMQNVIKMYVYKWAYLHRIRGIKELKEITKDVEELRGTVAKLKKNKEQFAAKVEEVVNNLKIGIHKIKSNQAITREEIKAMRDYLDQMIKDQLEALYEEQKKQQLAEEMERIRKLKEEQERKRREEEERKIAEEQARIAAEERSKREVEEERLARKANEKMEAEMAATGQAMSERLKHMPKMSAEEKQRHMMEKAELEQEKRDQELAMQLAMSAGGLGNLTEDSQQESKKLRKKVKKDGTPNLKGWEYAELKRTINETDNVDLLEACKVEFQRRMKLYNEWKATKQMARRASFKQAAATRGRAPGPPAAAAALVPGDTSYYHGKIDRDEAIRRLAFVNRNGSFLLRDGSEKGTYSISLQVDGNINHIRIANKPGGMFAMGKSNEAYPTVFKCIEANAGAKLATTMGQANVQLAYPVPAPGKKLMSAPIVAAAASRGAAPTLNRSPAGGKVAKPQGPHRFYKIAFVPAGFTKKGWWYGHFVGDTLVRQLELSREKAPALFSLGQPGLSAQKGLARENEITGGEFDQEWGKYGGRPYRT